MASKSSQQEPEKAEVIEELLDALDTTLDRVKVLYEQYFLGIQKQPPTHLHTDLERKIRDLSQLQIRNTALRYRFATLGQKFGSYNTYWRRTLRQIENGTYLRNLSKIGRQAARTGDEVPEEILAAMPKRMREQVRRDREAALALQRVRHQSDELLTLADEEMDDADAAAFIKESTDLRENVLRTTGAIKIDPADAEFDVDAYFASVTDESAPEPTQPVAQRPAAPAVAPSHATQLLTPSPRASQPAVEPSRAPQPATRPSQPAVAPSRVTQPLTPSTRASQPVVTPPQLSPTRATPVPQTQPIAARSIIPPTRPTPAPATPPPTQTQPIPRVPLPSTSQMRPIPPPPKIPLAPSQLTRPIPVIPGAISATQPVPVETMSGPFAPVPAEPAAPPKPVRPPATERTPVPQRAAQQRTPRPVNERTPLPERQSPPPGMTDADVNALYAKYVKAKEMVGEPAGPGAYGKLLKTINAQAPKIMEQYKAKGVDFSIVVKDNQVIIRAKPK